MATSAEIAKVRHLISEVDDTNGWDDVRIEELIEANLLADGSPNYPPIALLAWREKAAALSGLVDVSESGSSRRMAQAFDHALKMAGLYEGQVSAEAEEEQRTLVSARIVRPSRG